LAPTNPLLIALDFPTAEEAVRVATRLQGSVGGFKVGLELLSGPGPGIIAALRPLGLPVFVDAKLHDIPNTVGRAARRLGEWGARWITVHAAGGEAMTRAAVEGIGEGAAGNPAGVLAVTSVGPKDLPSLGVNGSLTGQVTRLAKVAVAAGAEGVVLAPRELGDVRQTAPHLLRVTPGIRSADSPPDDQARTATAEDAIRWGADYLVIGRPITRAADPATAAADILQGIRP
jgi:orotidine-5'-phosphate decarboxylase